MHGENWLNVSKFPKIEFVIDKLTDVTRHDLTIDAFALGKMTIGNVTLKMSIPIKLVYLANMLEKRNKVPGDLLIVKSEFFVKRDDFGIRTGEYLDKVANDIKISINLAGACPKS